MERPMIFGTVGFAVALISQALTLPPNPDPVAGGTILFTSITVGVIGFLFGFRNDDNDTPKTT